MIELDVEARPSKKTVAENTKARYLILGDFGGRAADPLTVDRDNLDTVLARLDVSLSGLRFREIEDFHPDHLVQRLGSLPEADADEPPARPVVTPKPNVKEILKSSGILDQILEGGDPFQRYLRELARAHAAPPKKDTSARDAELGQRLRALLHHPRFQEVESAWRGVDLITRQMDEEACAVHIAQMSRGELERDVLETDNLRGTRLFHLLTSRPWRGVFGLFTFGGSANDIELLGRIALIAAHAKTLFIAEGSADMGEHWADLRAVPESRCLGLALPRLLLRLPYGARTSKIESFPFEEMPSEPVHSDYLWGNAAIALAVIATRGTLTEEDDELDLTSLPLHTFQRDGEWQSTPCAEVYLTEAQVDALIERGLMPLVSFRDTDRVRVAGVRAINDAPLRLT